MTRTRITAVVLVAAILACKWSLDKSAGHPIAGPLEGTWEITSVEREGVADRSQIGSHLTFTGSKVTLQGWFAAFDMLPSLAHVSHESGTGKELVDGDRAAFY
jgi:hypothetical protein